MLKVACFFVASLVSVPIWAQVEPSATGGGFELDDTRMMTPPPVSSDAYPVMVGSEMRSNYFGAGLGFTGSYVNNLMLGGPTSKVSDEIYYFVPSVDLDRRTPRHSEILHYRPGFTLYQNTSGLNNLSQDGSLQYRFHISRYAALEVGDRFTQNNNLYNQSTPFAAAGGISGTPNPPNSLLIAPFASQLSNLSSIGISQQYARNAMIGISGSFSFLHYTKDSQSTGLNNGNTTGGMTFFSRRVARSEYVGVAYQFSKFITHPTDTYTVSHTVFGFYTHYFTRSFSASLLGGPERYSTWSATVPKHEAWGPAAQGSLGWQRDRTNLGVAFTHIVSGAQGLNGAFRADMANLYGRVAISPTWSAGADGTYSSLNSITPAAYPGGHTISSDLNVEHRIVERIGAAAGYGYLHSSYSQIAGAAFSPDSHRVYVSISYSFRRPLGR
jgi:hypothetical protein